ncbi:MULTISPECIES: phosphomannomutase CpsG [Alteromonadaceae]|uniref:phosphomannomutase CpsG n=1 Tax=Alteromonadaceae TaxID=72275 RepID=UPI001C09703C|nr:MULTISPECIES: phosphomannomutase CpsG [Aliiglaciecola]MBU2876125.1 phosphomannomutase CpsG [Aliiglaciecola lipolytica]MDO6712219.1 phosphomannomutase CpsG [Aliiglaciecola sp. 2_MG-2023]MDO6753543.1 phosphomannomutase CpsG [Aliiglaciecola sp. 1_MG-2023]
MQISCFKAYDIRGKLLQQLDENVAYRIGRAYAEYLKAKDVVVGGDVRHTSAPLKLALSAGLVDGGANVIDLGMTGTEEIYFATKHLKVDGGIEVTASHNPIDYNGMKLVKSESRPISGDTGLFAIKDIAEQYEQAIVDERLNFFSDKRCSDDAFLKGQGSVSTEKLATSGKYSQRTCLPAYVEHMLSYVDLKNFKPLKLVVNAGNGAAGKALDAIEQQLKELNVAIEFIKVHHQPDGDFPNGIPNPLLPESRADTADAVIAHKADMGIAWDGDFDRCFLFDEKGDFVEGYYIVGLLAKAFLDKNADSKIIYDPRVYWNTEDIVKAAGGTPIKSKTGHAFIKERMRKEDAVYGGEMSAHHYFRDFAYCDSGMIPWLLVAELICTSSQPLSELVKQRIAAFPSSGEINSLLEDADAALQRVIAKYQPLAEVIDDTDGVGLEFGNWRFNLRKSNTEPVIRLNVESSGDIALMEQKTAELLELIRA